jgi:predicted MFS family arabinose efflux permease
MIPIILAILGSFIMVGNSWAARISTKYGYDPTQFAADSFIAFAIMSLILFIYEHT